MVVTFKGSIEGYTAGWIASRCAKEKIEWFEIKAGDIALDMTDRDVVMFCASYWKPQMEICMKQAKTLVCFENDEQAKRELAGLRCMRFDMKKTAGRFAWEYFKKYPMSLPLGNGRIPCPQAPWLVDFSINPKRWAWPKMDQLLIATTILEKYPKTLDSWDLLATKNPMQLSEEGKQILIDSELKKGEKENGKTSNKRERRIECQFGDAEPDRNDPKRSGKKRRKISSDIA